jgi:hypothetical protein
LGGTLLVVRVVDLPDPRALGELQLYLLSVWPEVVEAAEDVATPFVEGDVVVEDDAGALDVATVAVAEHDFLVRGVAVEVDGVVDERFRFDESVGAVELVDVEERGAAHR